MFWRSGQKIDILPKLAQDISAQLAGTGVFLETLTRHHNTYVAVLRTPAEGDSQTAALGPQIEQFLRDKGGHPARVVFTCEKPPAPSPAPDRPGPDHPPQGGPTPTPAIRRMIAVASGKGGVGKSTVAVNLAATLARSGLSVGLLDADIYGPSIPTMMGIAGTRPPRNDQNKIVPVTAHGIKCLSMGLFTDPNAGAVIWRGPMVQSAILQMVRDADWADAQGTPLDILVIDMPPGTGDAQMAVAQKLPLTGAIIVSTPQDVALIDAEKAVRAFQKMNVPLLGLIENMSIFCCPNCGHNTAIFGANGARDTAARWGIPFLGALPLDPQIRTAGDTGTPTIDQAGAEKISATYRAIADTVRKSFV